MARLERSETNKRRIGYPSDGRRIDVLERVIAKLLAQSTVSPTDPDRLELNDIKQKLDDLDIQFPDLK